MTYMKGFSKFLSLIFVAFALSAGVAVFWYYEKNMPPKSAENKDINSKGVANLLPESNLANGKHLITLSTSLGDIAFETYDADAPKTVNNFITLSKKGFYSGLIFHRVIKGFMIQGGDPNGNGTGGPGYVFEDELNPSAASYRVGYKKGVVAMANAGPDTNGSQFFIMLADYPLQNNYTIFGKVVSGQDIVDKIGLLPTNAQDKPLTEATIKSVKVENK